MIISFFYQVLLGLCAVFFLPILLYRRVAKGKYKNLLSKRLGINFPVRPNDCSKCIWIHAVSVGEVKAVSALAKMLKKNEPNANLIVTTITETGLAEAKRMIPEANVHNQLPFDLFFVINRVVDRMRPDLVLITETDFWFQFLRRAKRLGAKIALVNGKISEKSLKRYQFFSFFSKRLFNLIDCFALQTPVYAERFARLGIPQSKIEITGNLKFDAPVDPLTEEEKKIERQNLGVKGDFVITIGSSHNKEEELLLDALAPVWQRYPDLQVLIAPRHPERFDSVAQVIKEKDLSLTRYSESNKDDLQTQVLLIDTMGLLPTCYRASDLALVAGSFIPGIGGHNILEPSRFGVPTLFGPYMETQKEMVDLVKLYSAGEQASLEDLPAVLIRLIDDSNERLAYGQNGLKLASTIGGATARTFDEISSLH